MKKSLQYKNAEYMQQNLDPNIFKNVPKNSIDYSVMEKSDKISAVICDFGWQDIGNWDAMSKLSIPDSNKNTIEGSAILHNVSDCYINNNKQVMAVIGVKNLIIVNDENGLLITTKEHSSEIKKIYSKLKKHRKENAC